MGGNVHEVISGRLYTARKDVFTKSDLIGMTVVIDLGTEIHHTVPENKVYFHWAVEDDVEERAFEGLIRMIGSYMNATGHCVLIVGHPDTVDVVATCAVREYLGCKPEVALGIVREHRPKALTKSELLETIFRYKPS
jgi:hypothetical protein